LRPLFCLLREAFRPGACSPRDMRLLATLLLAAIPACARIAIPISFEPHPGQSAGFLTHASGYTLSLSTGRADFIARGSRVAVTFPGSRPVAPEALDPLPGRVNYLVGRQSEWRRNIPTYARVRYRGLYPGIDLVYYGRDGALEYDFAVAAGADPRQIRLAFPGARGLSLDAAGDLLVETAAGPMRHKRPVVY